MRSVLAAWALLAALAPSVTRAQEATPARYEQGMGRGLSYGAYLLSPIHATPVERGGGSREPLGPGAGVGVQVRVGYELPDGFQLELYGGFAFNEIASVPMEDPMRSHVLTHGDVGFGLRYNLLTGTPFIPFARLGAGTRLMFFTWGSDGQAEEFVTAALDGALGLQIEVAPFFGVEVGALVEYAFGLDALEAGVVLVTPFAGVTLYLYDESDRLTAP